MSTKMSVNKAEISRGVVGARKHDPVEQRTIALVGQSGSVYRFNVYPMGTEQSAVAAVYCLLVRDSNGHLDVVFVDQSVNVFTRLQTHYRRPCFESCGANRIGIFEEQVEDKRLAIEDDLARGLMPCCNRSLAIG